MRSKILSLVLLLTMVLPLMLTACGSLSQLIPGGTTPSVGNEDINNPQKLQILKSDYHFTQEQMLSRIKADYLIKNGGYSDDDPIVAIVTLPDNALIDSYLNDHSDFATVADYATSSLGKAQAQSIADAQRDLICDLTEKGLISGVSHTYNTILNAVAVHTTYGQFLQIGQNAKVANAVLAETYNRPQAAEGTDASAIVNPVDVYPTGIFNSSSAVSSSGEPFTGKHTAVAVLDSGFDCEHTVFSQQPDGQLLITEPDVAAVLAQTNAQKLDDSLELHDVYYSKKIPFTFDYADKDDNVNPYDSEHGTHVAGIIGGLDDVITGVAVDTQLVLMKVFPDLDDGGKTDDILAALEDAVLLKVDAINMSLGSSCGFTREADGNVINAVYDKINESGISLITAASNSYSSAFGGARGNTGKVTNPDTSTVGSPSTYPAALSVASVSGTKSKYMVANSDLVVFFNESNNIAGKPNDFFAELGVGEGMEKTFDYVTIPGVGLKANYAAFTKDYMNGKIALVRRGDSTFEDKALQAKNAGAAGCIIYNNIEGDILMSMGKSDHIPTISISKEDGTQLAKFAAGKITVSFKNQAGPFMSDFSSWGPTPDLKLKPEITAHGGNIKSSVPGGGYDELSGTSMATPNLCGAVVLIRQYLKEKYPAYTYKQISVMTNQMLMSTATIIQNEEGNPYSPRKQGAGLASLCNVVNTDAYLTVDGIDRSKLELLDDPERKGIYEMSFNVVNLSESAVSYDLSLLGMTESISASDSDYVAEKSYILSGNTLFTVTGGTFSDGVLTVEGNQTAKIKAVYTLTDTDKKTIDSRFPYGMYVEGFVKLKAKAENGIDLNIPFLAFYGDWRQAPMFDKTYYEVESEAKNAAIDEEDKLKADYYATTPYGSYFYNYIIPLGTYLYDVDTELYDAIPATEEHIAISDYLGTIDGLSAVYAGLLRNAKTMTYSITDKVTGEVVKTYTVDNASKAYSLGADPMPNFEYLRWRSQDLGLVNNRQYSFVMEGVLDYGDGGKDVNVRNSFAFDFYLDNEAPVLKEVLYEKEYDKTLKKDRFYLTMTIYDNHYVQSVTPVSFTSSESYTFLSDNPIPVYSAFGKDNVVRIEITEYLEELENDALISNALSFSIDDYALNSNIYVCQLPGTKGDFKFTKDGTEDGNDLTILSIYENEVVDLTKYLYTADKTVDENKDYLRYLDWTSANDKVATVFEGQVRGIKAGRTSVTVKEEMDLKTATLLINVKARPDVQSKAPIQTPPKTMRLMSQKDVENADSEHIKSIRFNYFDTIFAYSRAAQTSKIGETGDRHYVSGLEGGGVSFYPGEKIQLSYDLDPWYVKDRYAVTFSSSNPKIAQVDQEGVVTALKKGSATISLSVEGSNLMAQIKVTVNSEFVIENRTLIAYKGLGGKVEIPGDEGILYIGAFAFCLYDTDNTVELSDEDYDANKIPATNTTVTEVVIPNTVEEIQKYAFYNCVGLKKVTIPPSVKYIREFAFAKDAKLETVDLSKVEVVGREAFSGCEKLTLGENDLKKTYSIGIRAFQNCKSIESVDLTALRNTGREAFKGCTSLASVTFGEKTRLSDGMFAMSGVTNVVLYETLEIPTFCFAQCKELVSVTLQNDLWRVGKGAFCENDKLTTVVFGGKVDILDEQAFYDCGQLQSITLPNSDVAVGNYCFYECEQLSILGIAPATKILSMGGGAFQTTAITVFTVAPENTDYQVSGDGKLLLSFDGTTVIMAATGADFGETYTLTYANIGQGAFSGIPLKNLVFTAENAVIGDFAFTNCESLESITFPATGVASVGKQAFRFTKALTTVVNMDKLTDVGDYAFANSALEQAILAENATFGEGAFYQSALVSVTVGKNTVFGFGAFQNCANLVTVNMPAEGNVHIGEACFASDAKLKNIDLTKTDSFIESQAFFGCRSLLTADMQNVTKIGDYAFADCSALNYVSFPKVEYIGLNAFGRYSENGGAPTFGGTDGTQVLTLPKTLTYLGDGAFIGCQGIREVMFEADSSLLPPSLEGKTEEEIKNKYWNYLFAYCKGIEKVTLPPQMDRIGVYAFVGCESLQKINLENVKEIGECAFFQCVALENVNLASAETVDMAAFASSGLKNAGTPACLVSVGMLAFQKTDLTAFNAPLLQTIGEGAFQDNAHLAQFVFTPHLTSVAPSAFLGCTSITAFLWTDGVSQTASKGKINDYAFLSDGVLYTVLPSGGYQFTAMPAGMEQETLTVLDGTVRVEKYAASENKHIKKVVLPHTLKLIGNYAFFGCENLEEVEFRSFTAPALESSYNSSATLTEKDPGYALLKNQLDLFALNLCYYTFVDLVGKKEPIKMTLPSNEDAEGYDGIVYQAYFGLVKDAQRSTYEAMNKTMSNFIDFATRIGEIETVTLSNENLINMAVSAMNAIKQDPTQFGYSAEEWNGMVENVTRAKARLTSLKLANARPALQNLQTRINALPDAYTSALRDEMAAIASELSKLTPADKSLLTLTRYQALQSSYETDIAPDDNPTPPPAPPKDSQSGLPAWAVVLIIFGSVTVAAGVAVVAVITVRKKKATQTEKTVTDDVTANSNTKGDN